MTQKRLYPSPPTNKGELDTLSLIKILDIANINNNVLDA